MLHINKHPLNRGFAAPSTSSGAAAAPAEQLPEWNLADLYSGIDAPELARDLKQGAEDAAAFEHRWKGKLLDAAKNPTSGDLGQALRDFEALEELLGRIGSYAGLLYFGDTSDPVRAKFYGDMQEKLTDASAKLLFFTLELNKIDDALIDAAFEADPGFAHYRPWIVDLRKDKPYQLEDRVEQLFHEKSVTGRGAWNRLFDETMTGLRFTIDGEELALEPTLNRLQDADGEVRREAAEALAKTFGENLRLFTLITNTL